MARRYLSVLLAAKMQFRLSQVEEALSKGDSGRAQCEAEELKDTWLKFGYMSKETHGELFEKIQPPVFAIDNGMKFNPPGGTDLSGEIQKLSGLLKGLAI